MNRYHVRVVVDFEIDARNNEEAVDLIQGEATYHVEHGNYDWDFRYIEMGDDIYIDQEYDEMKMKEINNE